MLPRTIMPDLITHEGKHVRGGERDDWDTETDVPGGADSWQTTRPDPAPTSSGMAQMHLSFLSSGLCSAFSGRKSWHKAHITASERRVADTARGLQLGWGQG